MEGAGHPSEGLHSLDTEGPRAAAPLASTGAGTRPYLCGMTKTRTSSRSTSEGLSSSRAAGRSWEGADWAKRRPAGPMLAPPLTSP